MDPGQQCPSFCLQPSPDPEPQKLRGSHDHSRTLTLQSHTLSDGALSGGFHPNEPGGLWSLFHRVTRALKRTNTPQTSSLWAAPADSTPSLPYSPAAFVTA